MSLLGLKGLTEMISIHPVFVHFPVALMCVSALFYFLGAATKKQGLAEAARWTLYAGTLTCVPAIWTGLRAEHLAQLDAEAGEIVELHEKLGFVILILCAALRKRAACFWPPARSYF